jgi:hypothetical protein
MNVTTTLCDHCKEKVGRYKCRICGADMCSDHGNDISIEYLMGYYTVAEVRIKFLYGCNRKNVCNKCLEKLTNQLKILNDSIKGDKGFSLHDEIIDEILKIFEKHARVEAI